MKRFETFVGKTYVILYPRSEHFFFNLSCRQEMIQRAEDRKADQTAHAQLVQSNYKESLARHEYAAQHPAYADGRVW